MRTKEGRHGIFPLDGLKFPEESQEAVAGIAGLFYQEETHFVSLPFVIPTVGIEDSCFRYLQRQRFQLALVTLE